MPIPRMTAEEFRESLAKLEISQRAAGALFANDGVDRRAAERQARRWASGYSTIPSGVAIALRLMVQKRVNPSKAYPFAVERVKRRRADG